MSDDKENNEGSDELLEQLRARLDALGVKYHHSHKAESLEALLAEAEGSDTPPEEVTLPDEAPAAAVAKPDPVTAGLVAVEVTKWGAGKISTGNSAKPFRDRGEIFHVPEATALSYEIKYFAQIVDD